MASSHYPPRVFGNRSGCELCSGADGNSSRNSETLSNESPINIFGDFCYEVRDQRLPVFRGVRHLRLDSQLLANLACNSGMSIRTLQYAVNVLSTMVS